MARSDNSDPGLSPEKTGDDHKIASSGYLEIWKEWNKLIWYTPLTFVSLLSAIAAILGAFSKELVAQIQPYARNGLAASGLMSAGMFLLVSTLILYRFAGRRDLVSQVLCKRYEAGFEYGQSLRGLDLVAFVINVAAFQAIALGAACLVTWDSECLLKFGPLAIFALSGVGSWFATKEIRKRLNPEGNCPKNEVDPALAGQVEEQKAEIERMRAAMRKAGIE